VARQRPQYSRYRRLPGLYRFHERKPDDPNEEPQRLTVYLTGTLLDLAEAQARRAGLGTAQAYCEDVLRRTIEAERDRGRVEDVEARRGPMEGLKAIADDPEYLAELSASQPRSAKDKEKDQGGGAPVPAPAPPAAEWEWLPPDPAPAGPSAAADVVLRHAGLGGDDPEAFLPALRRGEPIGAEVAQELLQALAELEAEFRDAPRLDRRLAYALHRLAFEGQVLLTDAWAGAAEATTVDVLRVVQEAVDRVLSGEDIRYFSEGPAPDFSP